MIIIMILYKKYPEDYIRVLHVHVHIYVNTSFSNMLSQQDKKCFIVKNNSIFPSQPIMSFSNEKQFGILHIFNLYFIALLK